MEIVTLATECLVQREIKLPELYQIPLVRKLELRGFQADYEAIQQFYETRVKDENLLKIK